MSPGDELARELLRDRVGARQGGRAGVHGTASSPLPHPSCRAGERRRRWRNLHPWSAGVRAGAIGTNRGREGALSVPRSSAGLLCGLRTSVVAARFHTVPTRTHLAPASAAVPALFDEQPGAIGGGPLAHPPPALPGPGPHGLRAHGKREPRDPL